MSKIKCLKCGTILISEKRHDFKSCNCENESFVDGGGVYLRIGGKDLSLIEIWLEKLNTWVSADRQV